MKETLGSRIKGIKVICADDSFGLRELLTPYGKAIVRILGTRFYGINNYHP
jgi:hypothetical protein